MRSGRSSERRAPRAAARTRARAARRGSASPSRCAQPPPQLRLPRGLARHVDLAARPAAHHRRAVQRVAVEQLGEVADGREAARAPVGVVLGAEVDGEAAQPRLVAGTRRRPRAAATRRAAASHGSMLGVEPGRGGDGVAGEPARERELDVRADAVGAAGRRAEARRHPLRQPALHAAGGDGDDVGRERVGQRVGQEPAERLDQARRRVQLGGCAASFTGSTRRRTL